MPHYELMCVGSIEASAQALSNLLQRCAGDLRQQGGLIRRFEHLGVRPLAYRMKAHNVWHNMGRYFRFYIQANPEALLLVHDQLRHNDAVVRYMVVKRPLIQKRPEVVPFIYTARPFDNGIKTFLQRFGGHDYAVLKRLYREGKISQEDLRTKVQSLVEKNEDLRKYLDD